MFENLTSKIQERRVMKKWVVALVLACMRFGTMGFAQNIPLYARGEHELVKTAPDVYIGASEKRCGDYFIFTAHYSTPEGDGPGISYKYKVTIDGKEAVVYGLFLQKKFVTVIKGGEERPTVEYTFSNEGERVTAITVSISKADYEKAGDCLPKPQ